MPRSSALRRGHGQINPSRPSRRSLITSLAAPLALFASSIQVHAQSITQPTSDTSITSFSGQGSIPFRFSPSSGESVSSINVELVQDGINFQLANGLLSNEQGTYQAVFAPISGFCGQVDLRVTENTGNSTSSSSDPTTRPITITCGPVQRTRSLTARQDQGGPSGSLNTPSGGTEYTSPDDPISISYTPVTEGGQTFAIDAALSSEAGNFTLTQGLWKQNSLEQITASFAIPSEACGAFNLIITEHQFYQNGAIQFQSAAPSINITCPSDSNGNGTAPIGGGGVNATSTMTNSTMMPTSTGVNATSTSLNSTTTTQGTPTFAGNITLPIETSTITSPTTIVSTVTTTFTQSGQTGTVTSVVTTTVSPSSTSTSSNSTRTSDTSTTSPTSRSSNGGGGGGGGSIRTTTITQTPSSQASNAGITTVTVTPSSSPASSASISRQTSTYTTTEVVVVAVPGRSSITSTRLQTVILVSQTIAAIVAPSSSGGSGGNGGTGAAVLGTIVPWSMTLLVGVLTSFAVFYQAL